jgi:hypothetical protein
MIRGKCGKTGKKMTFTSVLTVFMLIVGSIVGLGVIGHYTGINAKLGIETQQTALEQTTITGQTVTTTSTNLCGDTKQMTLTVTAQNKLNTTGTENYDNTIYWFDEAGNSVGSMTDTTAGTMTFACGKKYVGKIVSTDGNGGDSAKILSVSGDAKVVSGNVEILADISTKSITLYTAQHATLEARMYDNKNTGLMFDSSDASALDYETDGATFTSTSDNATAYDETTGVDVKLQVRATSADTDFNDFGVYVLLDGFDTSVFETPSVYLDNGQLNDVKGQLSVYESRAYSGYDYVFKFDKRVQDSGDGVEVKVVGTLISGATAGSDLQIDLASIGAYKSISSDEVKAGSVRDDATTTTVYAVQDFTVDIT